MALLVRRRGSVDGREKEGCCIERAGVDLLPAVRAARKREVRGVVRKVKVRLMQREGQLGGEIGMEGKEKAVDEWSRICRHALLGRWESWVMAFSSSGNVLERLHVERGDTALCRYEEDFSFCS